MRKKLDKKALAEADELLELLDDESYEKVPKEMLQAIKNERDIEYKIDIDSLLRGELMENTKDILCAIYSEYLATDEEKEVIDRYKESLKKVQTKKITSQEAPIYFYENKIQVQIPTEEKKQEETLMVAYKENIITKIITKIKRIFKKN